MRRRKPIVEVGWLQVPEDIRRVRAPTMADLLTATTGKRVSRGDALAMVLDLWAWVLGQVNEDAPSLQVEFDRCTLLEKERAPSILALSTGWPTKRADVLLRAMSDQLVRVLVEEPGGWRVPHLADRYLGLSADRSDARGRSRCHQLAKANGWIPQPGGSYLHTTTGEVVDGWRVLLPRLETKP